MSSRYAFRRQTEPGSYEPDESQRAVIDHDAGPLLVLGAPGTGKTSTLVASVAARVARGTPPERILAFTFGRRGAQSLRRRIASAVAPGRGGTVTEVNVHTFHAFAFAILRLAGGPPPKLLTGPEQDLIIRELLAESDPAAWPPSLRAAVPTRGFATQLRDLILRCSERGIDPPRLAAYGQSENRPEWTAAAEFYHDYLTQLALREGGSRYDTAEIVRVAASLLDRDPALAEAVRPEHVYVDELHDTDPGQLALLRRLASAGTHLVAFADPDSATFAFRGGDPEGVRRFPDVFTHRDGTPAERVHLTHAHRAGEKLLAAGRTVSRRLAGLGPHRGRASARETPGVVQARVFASTGAEAAHIADVLRTAHLRDGTPWSRMAVLVKSTAAHLPVLARALRQAHIPMAVHGEDLPLSQQPIVRPLLTLVRCGLDPKHVDEDTAVALLHSPFGGADPLGERRLRQALRATAMERGDRRPSGDLLAEALRDPDLWELPEEPWARPVRALGELMALVRDGDRSLRYSVEETLWAVWRHSGLAERLTELALSGGPRAASADADLDAMMTLFDGAANFTDRLPGAGPEVFVEHVLAQDLPADTLAAHADRGEAVRVVTAHAAKGLEWDLVVIAGVQEGSWPNLRLRDGLLAADALVDTDAGRAARDINRAAVLLAEERRLFYVAVGRARERLLVTAVDDDEEGVPSRFLEELGIEPEEAAAPEAPMTLPSLVARLRLAAADQHAPDHRRAAAAAQLSRLAEAGVAGADPRSWWGLAALSDDRPLSMPGEAVRVSPSTVESVLDCGLRWVLERHGGSEASGTAQLIGNIVHAAAEESVGAADVAAAMHDYVGANMESMPVEAPWLSAKQRERVAKMVDKFAAWVRENPREFVAAERGFTVTLSEGDVTVELSGKVDRLEKDAAGRLYIVDIKTGRGDAPSKADAEANPQMAAYQVAAEHGAFKEGTEAGGAALLHIGSSSVGPAVREQSALSERDDPKWAENLVLDVAERMAAATFTAKHTGKCATCKVKDACPISGKGRQVTD
ncbi:DNA helicase [Actinorhabdospora filicis]|uniref:DNA 3'-5' helicase n=1 Tax=Actinorhabdospora filicis TaxID=1785913 RepID=A0A9W6STA4_9ACTN|nr:ATP-dependent DNA helicase [Actinorhabdospora filicis]GLZ81948.1 DNA helicase [Actinorhabdospora filicis]